jgi:hypothetical protein
LSSTGAVSHKWLLWVRDFLKNIAPEREILNAIRASARKKGTDRLSPRDINREIRAHRKARSL